MTGVLYYCRDDGTPVPVTDQTDLLGHCIYEAAT